jgi:hypothetical protein
MDDDPVRPGEFGQRGGRNRVRFLTPPGLAQGGHMVNVHGQSGHFIPPD